MITTAYSTKCWKSIRNYVTLTENSFWPFTWLLCKFRFPLHIHLNSQVILHAGRTIFFLQDTTKHPHYYFGKLKFDMKSVLLDKWLVASWALQHIDFNLGFFLTNSSSECIICTTLFTKLSLTYMWYIPGDRLNIHVASLVASLGHLAHSEFFRIS